MWHFRSCYLHHFKQFRFPIAWILHMAFGNKRLSGSEEKSFKNVNGRRRMTEHTHHINFPGAFSSGELKHFADTDSTISNALFWINVYRLKRKLASQIRRSQNVQILSIVQMSSDLPVSKISESDIRKTLKYVRF